MKDIHVASKRMARNDHKIAKCKGCDIYIWTDYNPKIALGKYLANAKFGWCDFFPEPKVALCKDPLYFWYLLG